MFAAGRLGDASDKVSREQVLTKDGSSDAEVAGEIARDGMISHDHRL